MKKLRVGILFGGRSGEHEVSLLSAASVFNAIDKSKYEVVPIGITKEGRWLTAADAERLLAKGVGESGAQAHLRAGDPEATPGFAVLARGESVIVPPEPHRQSGSLAPFQTEAGLARRTSDRAINVDIIFPVLHGTFGEDGTIQGLLELADIPYVGAGVLGSAAGMDKDVMKSLFQAAGLPIVKHVTILRSAWEAAPKKLQKLVESNLKYPVFVKPANLGSSVGISKAHDGKDLAPAIAEAAKFDRKIVIEQGVGGKKQKAREIECSVLGNDQPEASVAGEIVPGKEFYDYTAKYVDEGSRLIIPAKLSQAEARKVRQLAISAFKAVDCSGLARVDFLMDPKNRKIYLNEINTMPGFTAISMYPKLWAASGLAYPDLIERLIRLGQERHQEKKRNQYSR
ncbi:MAG TPA: D-alanine--D-alanine ligase family protein [Terriglobales bacterium]|jgi:D-alanine-D-alanine ligase|nr:D-alanine--D-alanine ligase family protein [Terriglobales bacterium]HMJ21370.1 D-alanine--D-alanine ligase family protein [Terriglobales bacterium]